MDRTHRRVLTARERVTLARPLLRGELGILAGRLAMVLRMHWDDGVPSIRRAWFLPTPLSQEMPRSRRRTS